MEKQVYQKFSFINQSSLINFFKNYFQKKFTKENESLMKKFGKSHYHIIYDF